MPLRTNSASVSLRPGILRTCNGLATHAHACPCYPEVGPHGDLRLHLDRRVQPHHLEPGRSGFQRHGVAFRVEESEHVEAAGPAPSTFKNLTVSQYLRSPAGPAGVAGVVPDLDLDRVVTAQCDVFEVALVFDVVNVDDDDIRCAELLSVQGVGVRGAVAPAQITTAQAAASGRRRIVAPFGALGPVRDDGVGRRRAWTEGCGRESHSGQLLWLLFAPAGGVFPKR